MRAMPIPCSNAPVHLRNGDPADDEGDGHDRVGPQWLMRDGDRRDDADDRDEIIEDAGPRGADELDAAQVEPLAQQGREKPDESHLICTQGLFDNIRIRRLSRAGEDEPAFRKLM